MEVQEEYGVLLDDDIQCSYLEDTFDLEREPDGVKTGVPALKTFARTASLLVTETENENKSIVLDKLIAKSDINETIDKLDATLDKNSRNKVTAYDNVYKQTTKNNIFCSIMKRYKSKAHLKSHTGVVGIPALKTFARTDSLLVTETENVNKSIVLDKLIAKSNINQTIDKLDATLDKHSRNKKVTADDNFCKQTTKNNIFCSITKRYKSKAHLKSHTGVVGVPPPKTFARTDSLLVTDTENVNKSIVLDKLIAKSDINETIDKSDATLNKHSRKVTADDNVYKQTTKSNIFCSITKRNKSKAHLESHTGVVGVSPPKTFARADSLLVTDTENVNKSIVLDKLIAKSDINETIDKSDATLNKHSRNNKVTADDNVYKQTTKSNIFCSITKRNKSKAHLESHTGVLGVSPPKSFARTDSLLVTDTENVNKSIVLDKLIAKSDTNETIDKLDATLNKHSRNNKVTADDNVYKQTTKSNIFCSITKRNKSKAHLESHTGVVGVSPPKTFARTDSLLVTETENVNKSIVLDKLIAKSDINETIDKLDATLNKHSTNNKVTADDNVYKQTTKSNIFSSITKRNKSKAHLESRTGVVGVSPPKTFARTDSLLVTETENVNKSIVLDKLIAKSDINETIDKLHATLNKHSRNNKVTADDNVYKQTTKNNIFCSITKRYKSKAHLESHSGVVGVSPPKTFARTDSLLVTETENVNKSIVLDKLIAKSDINETIDKLDATLDKQSRSNKVTAHDNVYKQTTTICSIKKRNKSKAHLESHTGEKRFQCDVCNKWFRFKSLITKHMYIHSGVVPKVVIRPTTSGVKKTVCPTTSDVKNTVRPTTSGVKKIVRPTTSGVKKTVKPEPKGVRSDSSDLDSEYDDEFETFVGTTAVTRAQKEIPDDENLEEPLRDIFDNIGRGIDDEVDHLLGITEGYEWVEDFESFRGVPEAFSGPTPGAVQDYDSAYEAFIDIWDEDIIDRIVLETNRYAKQTIDTLKSTGQLKPASRLHQWVDTNANEIMVLLGVFMFMAIDPRTSMDEYWSTGVLGMSKFRRLMTYNRYILLMKFLHFVDNSDESQNMLQTEETDPANVTSRKLFKLMPIIKHLEKKFDSLYNLGRDISIDESLTLFKGRLSWVQTIRTKAARFGIKSYELCESRTGYMARFQIYTGKSDASLQDPSVSADLGGKSTKVVLELLQGLERRGHCVTMDNFYNCPALARYLKRSGFDCLGTLRTNRRNVPNDIAKMSKNVPKGTIIGRQCGDISVVAWKDSQLVTIISTFHDDATCIRSRAGKVQVKPVSVRDYNSNMGGVDLKDQKLSMYLLERKRGMKWYIKMFKRLLNISVHNAFIMVESSLRRRNKSKMSHREFRYRLAQSLVDRHRPLQRLEIIEPVGQLKRLRRDIMHVPKQGKGNVRKRCVVCLKMKIEKKVRSQCTTCDVYMCFERCWVEWHSAEELKTAYTPGRKRMRD